PHIVASDADVVARFMREGQTLRVLDHPNIVKIVDAVRDEGRHYLAMAIQVQTRLWLGGVLSTSRDMQLIVALMQKVRHSTLCRSLLFCVDGCPAYVRAIRHVFREPIRRGKRGRPRLRPWDGICNRSGGSSNMPASTW
ncbi:MAG: hypothetical protein ISS56_16265, partial [Anaerolineae bacterium]|nr:hypothetical protein [Anaerolineae bacterium]